MTFRIVFIMTSRLSVKIESSRVSVQIKKLGGGEMLKSCV